MRFRALDVTIGPLAVVSVAVVQLAALATVERAEAAVADCDAVAGVDQLLDPGAVVLVGELHGTEQSPAFVGALACHALAAGHAVTVALEWPIEERARVDVYLGSAGSKADRSALFSGSLWQASTQDGRASMAMLALLDSVRAHDRAGDPIEVALLDEESGTGDRDRWMAGHLVDAAVAVADGVVISLTGNVHAMVEPLPGGNPAFSPMGQVASEQLEPGRITALDVLFSGGTAWVCTDTCGETSFEGGSEPAVGFGITLHRDDTSSGYHGEYSVGPITASPPAAVPS